MQLSQWKKPWTMFCSSYVWHKSSGFGCQLETENEVNKKQEQKDSSTLALVLPFLFAEVGVGGTTK